MGTKWEGKIVQATIEIDLGSHVDDWEPVAYRKPVDGECWYFGGSVFTAQYIRPHCEVIIVRRKWVWPRWLKARWYCEDPDGAQLAYEQEPGRDEEDWFVSEDLCRLDKLVDIPKIGGDWRQSLRENPNWRPDNGQKDT